MARIPLLIFILSLLASLATATSAPTFCKCTCFTNYTIIPLGPQHGDPSTGPPPSQQHILSRSVSDLFSVPDTIPAARRGESQSSAATKRAASKSCSQCNRAFCLGYNLPICKDAEEKDVQTMCFQRDSRKDQIIVWGFILGTGGLLGWAGVKRMIEMREQRRAQGGLGRRPGEPDRGGYRQVGSSSTPRESVS